MCRYQIKLLTYSSQYITIQTFLYGTVTAWRNFSLCNSVVAKRHSLEQAKIRLFYWTSCNIQRSFLQFVITRAIVFQITWTTNCNRQYSCLCCQMNSSTVAAGSPLPLSCQALKILITRSLWDVMLWMWSPGILCFAINTLQENACDALKCLWPIKMLVSHKSACNIKLHVPR
jgi:hypothetical protein